MRISKRVLVVEDFTCFVKSLSKDLSRFGYILDLAKNTDEAVTYAAINHYDIFVIDVTLLILNDFSLLRALRLQNHNIKILILSTSSQLEDRVKCLEAGVNDYLVKPFTSNELIVRLNTLASCKSSEENLEIELGNIKVYTSRKKIQCMGCDVQLTPSEYKVMEHIVLCKGRVTSKNQLEEILYEADSTTCSNVVEVIVSNLRKKIKQFGVDPPIKTRRGFGYYAEV